MISPPPLGPACIMMVFLALRARTSAASIIILVACIFTLPCVSLIQSPELTSERANPSLPDFPEEVDPSPSTPLSESAFASVKIGPSDFNTKGP